MGRFRVGADVVSGLFLLFLAMWVMFEAYGYRLGSLRRMGPGFYPLMLGGVLAILSIGLILKGRFSPPFSEIIEEHRRAVVPILILCASLLSFVFATRYLGIIPATFILVFISCSVQRPFSFLKVFATALFLGLFVWIVFVRLFGIPFQLLRWG
jgi:hypothetical protein